MCVVFITRIFFKEYHIYIYTYDNMKKVQKVVFGKRFITMFTKIWIVVKRKKRNKTIKTTHQKEKFKNNNIN